MERITATIEYANKMIDAERQDITKPSNASYWEAFLAGAIAQSIEDYKLAEGALIETESMSKEIIRLMADSQSLQNENDKLAEENAKLVEENAKLNGELKGYWEYVYAKRNNIE